MTAEHDQHNDRTQSRRFGNRATIEQPAILTVGEQAIRGVISNVGLRGAFFASSDLPAAGTAGTLAREGARGVDVWVVWQREGVQPGVGLSFDAPGFGAPT